jgi:hypothetical protein
MAMLVRFADGTTEDYEDEPHGGGAQGDIFRPRRAGGYGQGAQPQHVIKLYKYDPADVATARVLQDRIQKMVNDYNPAKDDPYWSEFFAWPEKMIVAPRIGFRMPWAQGMRRLDDYLYELPAYWEDLDPSQRGWFIGRLAAALKLAQAAARLAKSGLCYADFSHRNAMVDPFEGRMMLIDCDALTIPDVLPPDVLGTPGYIAPEIMMDDSRPRQVTPSIGTDRHALATLLYRWFLGYHPLDGDHPPYGQNLEDHIRLAFGERALYIEHPSDLSNRRQGQVLTSEMLGDEIKRLFREAFVDGLHNPARRPTPQRWAEALARAFDRVIPCNSLDCEWRFFIAEPHPGLACPACAAEVDTVRSLPRVYIQENARRSDPSEFQDDKLRQHWVVGWPGRTLHDWHMEPNISALHAEGHEPDRTARATFGYDAGNGVWHITNQTQRHMKYQPQGAGTNVWEPWESGKTLLLHDGMRLQFGDPPHYNRAFVNIVGLR